MKRIVVLNTKMMRHVLLVLAVIVGACAFDNYYASLNLSWSEQVENLMHQDGHQDNTEQSQVLQLCAVSAGSSFKVLQDDSHRGLKLLRFVSVSSVLEKNKCADLSRHAQLQAYDVSPLGTLHFLEFNCHHQSSDDEHPLA